MIEGLNENLMPIGSPITQNQGLRPAYQFDYENDPVSKIRNAAIGSAQIQDASIGSAQVGTLSFNQISGGTATLGGTSNGNGVLSIRDSGGTERVRGDSSGVTITDGALTFVSSGGGTIIDSNGLNGTAVFAYGQGSATSSQNITALGTTNYTDVTSGSVSIVLSRQSNVFLTATVTGRHNNDGDGIGLIRFVDVISGGTTQIGPRILIRTFGTAEFSVADTHSASFISTLSAGTHTVKLQATQNNVGGTLTLTDEGLTGVHTVLNYLVLGN